MGIEQNTVAATGQVVDWEAMRVVQRGGFKKVLFVGNSITRHGPKPAIGWEGDWGMAASAPEKDYVHQTVTLLEQSMGLVDYAFVNFSKWEVNFWDDSVLTECDRFLQFEPDIVVMRLGENIWSRAVRDKLQEYDLYVHFDRMIKAFAKGGATILLTDLFWPHPPIDSVIHRVAANSGYPLVHLGDLGELDENKAIGLFEHTGVAAHPGDLGMHRIAQRIASAILAIAEGQK
ncbi:MAG: SGNH/GDSL hydrolase family protein [Clostridia bacterium]|nr:SGNH/GDSL hydrolase family protein [Clostridia bacterium]